MRLKVMTLLLALVVGLFGAVFPAAAEDVWLRSSRDIASRIPLGVLGVVGGAGLDPAVNEARQVLMDDLRRSGVFAARDLGLHLAQAPDQTLGPLRLRDTALSESVEVLGWMNLTREAGKLMLHAQAFDGVRGTLLVEKRYRAADDQLRAMVHRFVAELVYHYTGEYGISRSRIAFVSDLSGAKEIYVMDYDGHAPRRVTADRAISLTPALANVGNRVLYAGQQSGNWRIYQLELGSGQRVVAFSSQGLSMTPAWHPKGDGFAVTGSEKGNREIFHVSRDGSVHQLTSHPADDLSPSWSPDGRRIAFTSNRGGSPQVYVMDANGANQRRLSFGGDYNSEPDWSPAGDLIAFTCKAGQWFKVCVSTFDGANSRQITTGDWDDEGPTFSPDGRHLAFSSTRAGRSDIYLMDVDGSNAERITYNGANNTNPDWANLSD
ncbi:MAG: Tol-Pal system beta propeller repeat protein TolB [Nitrospirota bacterium]|nr:Tol-Pal system beta propeller repeat protein TolB [Nitrospirota bacterium]